MTALRRTLPILLASAALLAPELRGASAQCVLLEVSGPISAQPLPGHFSATRTVDLTLRTHLTQSLQGNHVVQFRVQTPTKSVYQAIDVPIVDPLSGKAGTRSLAGYPLPVKEQKPKKLSAAGVPTWAAEAAFPVGGTSIVSSGLYGNWTVQAMLDDFGKPLCSATFVIDP